MTAIAEPLPASTLILLRTTEEGVELFMMKRNPFSDFAPGALVFPGGMLEEIDTQDWSGLIPSTSNCDPLLAYKIAAIRETFEESGILLAFHQDGRNYPDEKYLQSLQPFREKLNNNALSFRDFISDNRFELAVDDLHHCANWVTPKLAPKRFDTHFFVAKAPPQSGVHDGAELVESFWVKPDKVLEFAETDEYRIVFATEMNALWVSKFSSIDAIIHSAREATVNRIEAEVDVRGDKIVLCIPESAGYGVTERLWRM